MFIHYFAVVPLPADQVELALLHCPADWLPGLAHGARDHGQGLLTEVGVGAASHRVTRRVEVEIGQPLRVAAGLALPLRWHAEEAPTLFPELDADLEVAPLGPDHTQLALSGQYQPPLGVLGRAIDRLLLHRIAEAVAKDFVDRVATQLVQAADGAGVGDHPDPNA